MSSTPCENLLVEKQLVRHGKSDLKAPRKWKLRNPGRRMSSSVYVSSEDPERRSTSVGVDGNIGSPLLWWLAAIDFH
jgi:hypothetical protein